MLSYTFIILTYLQQSIGWLLRKAISYATITLDATHYEDPAPESAFHLDISTTVTGGIKTTVEKRVLDWTYREHADNIFGNLKGRSRLVKLHDVEDDVGGDGWIKQGWEEAGGEFLESWVKNEEYGWTAHQIWGFDVKDKGERKYVRRIVVRKGDEVKNARMVYDYLG